MAAHLHELDELDILFRDALRPEADRVSQTHQGWLKLSKRIEQDRRPRRLSFLEHIWMTQAQFPSVSQDACPVEWSLFLRVRIAF